MKISRAGAVPLPEPKPAPPPAVNGGDGGFTAMLNPPPAPARKPQPEFAANGVPLPRAKPDPTAAQLAQAPVPGRKPDAPAAASPQTQVAQGTTTQVAPAPLPDRKPAPPVNPALLAATEAPTRNGTAANAEERIKAASRQVAGLSGHSYRTILAQATQESGLNPHAKSKTSSAAGPFQFLERTWLDMFRRHGAAYGMGDLADKIQVRDGVPTVKDPALRKQILDLRHDVDISAGMAARLLSEGRGRLEQRLKRPVTETESRLAYVFGVGGALTLIRAAEKNPDKPAADLLPGAAKANGPLFYDRKTGQALSVAETLQRLQRKMNVDQRDMFAAIDDASGRLRLDGGASPFGAFQTATDMTPPSPLDDAESVAGDGKPV